MCSELRVVCLNAFGRERQSWSKRERVRERVHHVGGCVVGMGSTLRVCLNAFGRERGGERLCV